MIPINIDYTKLSKLCIASVLLLSVNFNLAQAAPTPGEREEQNRRARQEEQDRQLNQQKPDVFLQKEREKRRILTLPEETPSFPIQKVALTGKGIERFSWAQDIVDQYAGQKIGWQGINLIVKSLTEAFVDRGFVTTRVLIPQQNLAKGTLTLLIVPGLIQDIRLADPTMHANWKSAFPARPGQILNLRDLEQGLEQMKRVPSQDVDMKLLPGDKEGESIVLITVKQTKPWKAIVSLDDSGSKATGKLQASETFAYDNLFSSNDLFNLSYNSDADRERSNHGTRGNSLYYSAPQGYWTYTFSSSTYQYHQSVATIGNTFVFSGETTNLELKAERLVYRDQARKTTLGFSLIQSHSKSYVDDTEIEVQRRDTTATKLAVSQKQYLGKNVLDYTVAYKRGVPWFGAQDDLKGPDLPTSRYDLWMLDASLSMPVQFGRTKAQYSATLHGQYTPNRLYGCEFLSIGNRYTVRGFDGEQTLSAENGWYLQNELDFPLSPYTQMYLGLDCGQISGPSANQSAGKTIAGTVLGFRGKLDASRTQYDVFIGSPLKKPDALGVKRPVVGFQLVYQI